MNSLWRWWTETWHAPRRARLLYGAMAPAFAALAVAGAVLGDALVAAVAGVAAAAAGVLAGVAPRLGRLTGTSRDVR